MKFLVSVPKQKVMDDKWTTERKPVVPCFPSQGINRFITIPEFKLADRAEVADIDDDPDEMVAALHKEYPGLPKSLHENYVMGVFKFAFDRKIGDTFRILVNQRQAILTDEKTEKTTHLWDEQPL